MIAGWKRLLVREDDLARLKRNYHVLRDATAFTWLFHPSRMVAVVTDTVLIVEHMVLQHAPTVDPASELRP